MRRMMVLFLVLCSTACGSGSSESEPQASTAVPQSSGGDEPERARGQVEHECIVARMQQCGELACRWIDDPDAPPSAPTETGDADASLRDDVTIGPRRASLPGDGQLCVQSASETTACPAICCSVCPRE